MENLRGNTEEWLHEFLEIQRRTEDPSAEGQSGAIPGEIERFVRQRARNEDTYRRMIDYLTRVQKLETNLTPGTSKTRSSGNTDYIRVHANGPRMLGAVAYVKPRMGAMDLRLLPGDVADLNDGRVKVLQRKVNRPYQIRCHLSDDTATDLALELTERALDKLRP